MCRSRCSSFFALTAGTGEAGKRNYEKDAECQSVSGLHSVGIAPAGVALVGVVPAGTVPVGVALVGVGRGQLAVGCYDHARPGRSDGKTFVGHVGVPIVRNVIGCFIDGNDREKLALARQ